MPKGVQGFLDHQKHQQRKKLVKRAAEEERRLMSHARRRRDEGADPAEIEIEIADMIGGEFLGLQGSKRKRERVL